MTGRLPVLLFVVVFSLCPLSLRTDVPSSSRDIVTLELPTGTYRYVDQELLVQPREHVSIGELNGFLSAYGGYIEDADQLNRRGYAVVVFPRTIDVFQAERAVRASPLVKYAHLNYVGTFATTDPYFDQQWALSRIEAQEGWDGYTKGSSSVIVAILDSGFTPHEDLAFNNSRIIQDPTKYNFTDVADYQDDQDHAMGVAGIIASETDNATGIAGVAWYPKLWFIKVGRATADGMGLVTCD